MKTFRSLHPAALALALVALALLWCGCQSTRTSPNAPYRPSKIVPAALNEGDVIQITFPGATNLNTGAIKIPYDGHIPLPFVERFKAAGRTPKQLQDDVLAAYGNQLQLKEVTVTVIQSSATVYVSGGVLRPGRVPLDRPMTAMEVIMECGGFGPKALPNKVRLIRLEESIQKTYSLDLRKALNGLDTNPVYLKPSDVLHVPERKWNL